MKTALANLLKTHNLDATPIRLAVLEVLHTSHAPMQPQSLLHAVQQILECNKVTLYRTLDLFTHKHIVQRHSSGGRAACYCMLEPSHPEPHGHFYCTSCGQMSCIPAKALNLDMTALGETLPMHISHVDLRLDGICSHCLPKGA